MHYESEKNTIHHHPFSMVILAINACHANAWDEYVNSELYRCTEFHHYSKYNRPSIAADFGTYTIHLCWCNVDYVHTDCFVNIRPYLVWKCISFFKEKGHFYTIWISFVLFTNASALTTSLESYIAWAVSLIIFNVSRIGSCMRPSGVSIAVRLGVRRLRWIILRVNVWAFSCCRRCCCSCRCGSRCKSRLFTSEWAFRIAAFKWFSTIVTAQCAFIVIFSV